MTRSILISCVFVASDMMLLAAQPANAPLVPKGVYANLLLDGAVNQAQLAAYYPTPASQLPAYPNPNLTRDPTDAVLVGYLTTLLNNPAISGLSPQIPWYLLNPKNPGPDPSNPKPGAYTWNALDDVFTAVDNWNASHRFATPKTIQLIVSTGFNTPNWVFKDIDNSVCGSGAGNCGSCDTLFMFTFPVPVTSPQCGYTTMFWKTEGNPVEQIPLPMPWNAVYKTDQQTFLTALNQRVQQEASSSAFVSITMSGPTASSSEMILPNTVDQVVTIGGVSNNGILTLPNDEPTLPNLDTPAVWNKLIANYYGANSPYINTDQPFIQEWDSAIDLYSGIFKGVTLCLVTTTDALPDFPDPTDTVPAPGFSSDCGITSAPNNEQCAAVTWVLYHFTNPNVGGSNAKLIFEAGMTASRDSADLGTNGVKWLAFDTAGGMTPLQGTPYRMSRILAGMQFSHVLSTSGDLQSEGCPTNPTAKNPTPCPNLTPAEGYFNVMQQSYLTGTDAGLLFGAPTGVTYGNWSYKNAPMNFLEIYDVDVLYASGLSNCSTLNITGRPASPGYPAMSPDVSACAATTPLGGFGSVLITQAELDLTSLAIWLTEEGPAQ